MALAFHWDGRRPRLFFQTRRGTYRTDSLIGFLRHLRRHFRRQRLILLWDGLPGHTSAAMRAHLASQRHWLTAERLPGYAPDLNPVESIFGNVKGRELANHCGPSSRPSPRPFERASAACAGGRTWLTPSCITRAWSGNVIIILLHESH